MNAGCQTFKYPSENVVMVAGQYREALKDFLLFLKINH